MASKIVYANAPYIYAYAWHSFDQKAAKIPENTPLEVIAVIEGWYEIKKLAATGGAYQPADRWFVDPIQTHEALIPLPEPEPEPGPVYGTPSPAECVAFVKVLHYIFGG